jgi:hypothetical protein
MIVGNSPGFLGCGDGRNRLINNKLVLPKSLPAAGANSEMLLEPLLFLFS